jgi:ankyrin repeat protein
MSSLSSLPNEILLLVAERLGPKDVNSFLQTNRRFAVLFTQCLHKLALQDVDDFTSLQWAAWSGHKSLARLVLAKGADINYLPPAEEEDKTYKTALHLACENGDEEMVQLLLTHGADTSTRIPPRGTMAGTTALHMAVKSGSENVVATLLSHGANPSVTDINGNSPLIWAIGSDHIGILRLFLEGGADLSLTPKGTTPLHWAARLGHDAMVRMLLAHGADSGIQDATGLTALGRVTADRGPAATETIEGRKRAIRALTENERRSAICKIAPEEILRPVASIQFMHV